MDDIEKAAGSAAPNPADQSTPPNPAPETTSAPDAVTPAPDDDEDDEGAETPEQAAASKSAERRQRRRQQREAERSELAFYRQQAAARPQGLTLDERVGPPPDPRDFRDQASYAAELAAYNIQKRGAASAMAAEKRQQDALDQSRIQAREARGEELTALARDSLPDFDRTVQRVAHVSVPQAALDAIAESDLRPQLMYHLGKNPDTANALSRMTPVQAVKEIGRLEARLSAAPAQRTTQAPAPLTRLNGGAAGPVKTLAEAAKGEDASDFIALRRAERAKQRA